MEQQHVYDVYSKIASQFDNTRYSHWNCIANFLNSLPKYSIVADIGTGNGKYLNYRNDITVIGNDTCNELLQVIVNKDINRNKPANVLQANGLNLPYKDQTFDAVISVAVMHHLSTLASRKQFMKEALRILRPGGECIITVWSREQHIKPSWEPIKNNNSDFFVPWVDTQHNITYKRYYHLFTRDELEDLVISEAPYLACYSITHELDNWCLELTTKG